jgi:protein-S-isoprenylcysteine O-methyltransferase Ste14
MKKELFYILVIICIVSHIIRATYEILKHKKRIKATRLSFIIVFTNMLMLWASWFALCILDTNSIDLPDIFRYFGIFLVVLGILVFLTGLFTIKALESYDGDLMTHGIYSKIRHPMYLGFILWLIGMPVYCGGLISFALCIVFIVNVLFWRNLEEKELENRFPAYKEYKKTTIF